MSDALPVKLLFLGDSFTVGTGLGEGHEAFPHQLKKRLEAQGIAVAPPKLYAVNGHTTKHLLGALDMAEPASHPDHPQNASTRGDYAMVTLCIGANDIFRGHTLADYKHHFEELSQRAIRFAGNQPARVMAVSIPAWDTSPSVYSGECARYRAQRYEQVRLNQAADPACNTREGIAAAIDAFNDAAGNIAAQQGIAFVDITGITRQPAAPDASLFTADGLHYSGRMYARWIERLLPRAMEILRGR